MTQPVSQKTEGALRVAMKRLLDGTADGVDASGALRLQSAEGLLLLNSGEVSVRRRA